MNDAAENTASLAAITASSSAQVSQLPSPIPSRRRHATRGACNSATANAALLRMQGPLPLLLLAADNTPLVIPTQRPSRIPALNASRRAQAEAEAEAAVDEASVA